jgi:hypothetical protein
MKKNVGSAIEPGKLLIFPSGERRLCAAMPGSTAGSSGATIQDRSLWGCVKAGFREVFSFAVPDRPT